MRFVIQRVNHACVRVDGEAVGTIGKGFLVLVGVCPEDNEAVADKMVHKLCGPADFRRCQRQDQSFAGGC